MSTDTQSRVEEVATRLTELRDAYYRGEPLVADADYDALEDELRDHCRRAIAGFKVPKAISIQADPLPKSGPGKILKRELRAPYWD